MKHITLFVLVVLSCASFVFVSAEELQVESTSESDWKDKAQVVLDKTVTGAKAVGGAVAESTKSGYVATKEYFGNNTVGDIAGDVADGAKKVGTGIADGAKKAWNTITDLFS
ncbi:CLUMA_CG006145, isoform A [Clunio marinus]|uniref:CLUMA_CG006145, isoform A n=1 Tax=Clunio marinus TaxID=568069 RepID=A0A1J1HX39_9DIPT|nr:CLUMA_CG006145, isoform A [Clunio marinus]